MKKTLLWLTAVLLLISACGQSHVEREVTVKTDDGREVMCTLYLPAQRDNMPVLVIAPGMGYHRGLPLIAELAKKAVKEGFAVMTFDWHYFSNNSKPEKGYLKEYGDIKAVTEYVKSMEGVDGERLVLAGK